MEEIVLSIRASLLENASEQAQESGQRYFKETTKMYGMKTAVVNRIAKQHLVTIRQAKLNKSEIFAICDQLWSSGYIEESFVACIFSESLHKLYQVEDFEVFAKWVENDVSNWASCDTLCNHTVGDLVTIYPELTERLLMWTQSDNRWVKRAAAVSLIVPARKGLFLPVILQIANELLLDQDDMVQKGYGWMLKAASEAHQTEVFDFVMSRRAVMPRTALRYAIEKMPRELKDQAMAKPVAV